MCDSCPCLARMLLEPAVLPPELTMLLQLLPEPAMPLPELAVLAANPGVGGAPAAAPRARHAAAGVMGRAAVDAVRPERALSITDGSGNAAAAAPGDAVRCSFFLPPFLADSMLPVVGGDDPCWRKPCCSCRRCCCHMASRGFTAAAVSIVNKCIY